MASASAIEAGRAFVRLLTDDSALRKGLKVASQRLLNFSKAAAKIGAATSALGGSIAAPLVAAVHAYESAGSKLADAAARTGIPVETLSALGFAAEQSASDLDTLENGLKRMSKVVSAAFQGSKGAQKALEQIGLKVQQLEGMSPDEQFRVIAEGLSRIVDPGDRAAAAMAIFGKAGTALLPLMNGGAAAIAAMEAEARRLGLTMSTEDAAAAEQLGDSIGTLKAIFWRTAVAVGSVLAPTLQTLLNWTIEATKGVAAFIAENKGIVLTVAKVAAGLIAVGGALTGLAALGVGTAGVLSGLSAVAGVIGTAFAVFGSVLAFVVSPLGLIVAAVVGLVTYTGAAGAAINWLGEQFGTIATSAMQAFGAIGKALASGDIGLAARVLWAFLKMEWQSGVSYLFGVWSGVKDWFQTIWADAVFGAASVAANAWGMLQSAFVSVVNALADTWSVFTAGITKGWHNSIGFIQKAWTRLKALFNSDINVDAEVKRIDRETAQKNSAVDTKRDQAIGGRDADARKRQNDIEAERKKQLEQIGNERKAADGAREEQRQKELQQSADDLRKAQEGYAGALKEVDALPPTDPGKPLASALAGAENRFADISFGVNNAESKVTSAGTFSAAGVAGLQVGSFDKRIATATEQTAKHTKAIAELDFESETLGD